MIPAQKEAGVMEAYLFSDTQSRKSVANQTNSDIYSKKNGKYKESIILYRSIRTNAAACPPC